jgi:hypothetical protein
MWYLLLVAYWEKDSLLFYIKKLSPHTTTTTRNKHKVPLKDESMRRKKHSKPRISAIKVSYQDRSCHTNYKESESRNKNKSQWDPDSSNKITTPRRESHFIFIFSVKAKLGNYGSKYLNDSPHKESTILGVESTGKRWILWGERMIATAYQNKHIFFQTYQLKLDSYPSLQERRMVTHEGNKFKTLWWSFWLFYHFTNDLPKHEPLTHRKGKELKVRIKQH